MDEIKTDFLAINSLSALVNIPSYEQRISKLLDETSDDELDELGETKVVSEINMKHSASNQTVEDESFRGQSRNPEKRKDGGGVFNKRSMESFPSVTMPYPKRTDRQLRAAHKDCYGKSEDELRLRDTLNKALPKASMSSMESIINSSPALKTCMERVQNADLPLVQHLQMQPFASIFSGLFQSSRYDVEHPPSIFSKINHFKDFANETEGFDEAVAMKMIKTLVTAQEKYCSETPKPGSEKWTEFRKQQEDEFLQKLTKPNRYTLDVMLAIADDSVICIETIVRQATKFCLKIPGFNDLDMEDKIMLIKESRQETQVPSFIRSYDRDFKIASPLPGYSFIVEDVRGLMPEKSEAIFKWVKEHSERSIWTDITDEEDALLKAIVFTDADRCARLQNRDKVIMLHRRYIACLMYYLQKTFKDKVFERQEDIEYYLTTCRSFSASFHSYMKEKLLEVPGHDKNQTLNEVFL